MLKFLLIVLFIIPVFIFKLGWHKAHIGFYFCRFIFLIGANVSAVFNNLSYAIGYDLISYGLIILSFWVRALIMTASQSVFNMAYNKRGFGVRVVMLLVLLFLTFRRLNLIFFYIYFESSLIPTLFLILGWGYQPERIQAGSYLLFYTLFASLPLLIGLLKVYSKVGLVYSPLLERGLMSTRTELLYLVLVFAFLVKIPIFLVHLWLPKAHVEAPIRGSIILAGVLLKLGGYGLIRVINMLSLWNIYYSYIWVRVSLAGGVLVSLLCLRQRDIKALVAYSSVAHMGLVVRGLMTINYWGLSGSFTIILAHGLCSSGLFCLTNIRYERTGRRSLLINRGLINIIPSLCVWWFLLRAANMAAPPTLNLLGEISLLNRIISWSWVRILSLIFLSFISAAYSLFLYSYSQHGRVLAGVYSRNGGYVREYLLLILHWLPLNLLIIKGELVYSWLYLNSLKKILICGVKDAGVALGYFMKYMYLYSKFDFFESVRRKLCLCWGFIFNTGLESISRVGCS